MEAPRHWRLKKQRYNLRGEICNNCRTPTFPPRAVCPHCGGGEGRVSLDSVSLEALFVLAQENDSIKAR